MSISERIESLRKKRGVSLTHLNSEIGAYRGKLTEVRKGKASLNEGEISILAKALSTSVEYLKGTTDDPSPTQKEPTTVNDSGLDEELISRLCQLTPAEMEKVDAFVQGLLASR